LKWESPLALLPAGFFFAVMTDERKQLYRELLHRAMIDMRAITSDWGGPLRWWWWQKPGKAKALRFVNDYTDWIHNLALYSAWEFKDFNEEWFWRDYQTFRDKYPSGKLALYGEGIIEQLKHQL